MSLRERIENNVTLFMVSIAVPSFLAGMAVDQWAKSVSTTPPPQAACKTEEWQELARNSDWAPVAQCPAFPLKLQITSPGSEATFQRSISNPSWVDMPFVLSASRKPPVGTALGFVVRPQNAPNYFIVFPVLDKISDTTTYRASHLSLPVSITPNTRYEVRGVFVNQEQTLGDRFTSLAQILAADPSVILTEPITVVSEN